MQPTDYYQSILDTITDDLERRVFQLLSSRVGSQTSRSFMIFWLFGEEVTDDSLASNPHDRAIRKCIENLRNRDYPIVASSGEAGYCLTDDPEQINACIAEERARVKKIEEKIGHMQRSRQMAHDLHLWRQGAQLPVQLRLV